jgi:serine/threonine protein kinase
MSDETTPFAPAGEETFPSGTAVPPAGDLRDPFPGEFRLIRRVGSGTFGEVWLAEDLSPLGRAVALKFLRLDSRRAELALATLRNEARLLASLRHPNLVQVHAWRTVPGNGLPCLVLQYVPGGSLEQRVVEGGPLPWVVAARYVADVADGLQQVHRRGIIHRDVKPANMLLDPDADEALLTDFGIAARLIDPRTVAGTPRYMAPEAFRGEASPALDVYGLAASLFWLVTGTAPFDGHNVQELVDNVERGLDIIDPRFAGLPRPLERLIRAGLHARAAFRPDLARFAKELRGTLNLLLADCLAPRDGGAAPVDLRLLVSRQVDSHTCLPVASSVQCSDGVLRDLKRVPRDPERVTLHTGDRLRLEVVADQPGHITVFNVGPSGNINLLWPLEPGMTPPLLPAHQVLPILAVELAPPAGTERLFALWTRRPLPLRLDELRSLVEHGDVPAAGPYRATRDMVRVQQTLQQLPPDDRHAVVLELDHQ